MKRIVMFGLALGIAGGLLGVALAALGLPMLLRLQNYPEQSLDELARTAAAGARNGVVIDDA